MAHCCLHQGPGQGLRHALGVARELRLDVRKLLGDGDREATSSKHIWMRGSRRATQRKLLATQRGKPCLRLDQLRRRPPGTRLRRCSGGAARRAPRRRSPLGSLGVVLVGVALRLDRVALRGILRQGPPDGPLRHVQRCRGTADWAPRPSTGRRRVGARHRGRRVGLGRARGRGRPNSWRLGTPWCQTLARPRGDAQRLGGHSRCGRLGRRSRADVPVASWDVNAPRAGGAFPTDNQLGRASGRSQLDRGRAVDGRQL